VLNQATSILANDLGTGIVLVSVTGSGSPCGTFPCTIATAHGSAVVQPSGTYVYTPAPGYSGPDGFTYQIRDVSSQTAGAAVSLAVTPVAVDDGPFAVASGSPSTSGGASILSNDAGTGLAVSSVTGSGAACSAFPCVVATPHGSVTVQSSGTFSYTSSAGYTGSDTFTYAARDSSGKVTNTATVRYQVVPAASLLGPPSGTKSVSEPQPGQLEWRMAWINAANAAPIGVQVFDPIPTGTTYVNGSIRCQPQGLSTTKTPVSANCWFDAASNRVFWQGTIAADPGATGEEGSANKVVITFRTSVASHVSQVFNQAMAVADSDGDGVFNPDDPASVALSNRESWAGTLAIPGPGFLGLGALAAALAAVGWFLLRRS